MGGEEKGGDPDYSSVPASDQGLVHSYERVINGHSWVVHLKSGLDALGATKNRPSG